jgi:hypothetical protein
MASVEIASAGKSNRLAMTGECHCEALLLGRSNLPDGQRWDCFGGKEQPPRNDSAEVIRALILIPD